jgi:hypothetical protein
VTGKPPTGPGYAPTTVAHSETVLRHFYDIHRDVGTGPLVNPFPLDLSHRSGRAHAHHHPMDGWKSQRVGRYRPPPSLSSRRRIPNPDRGRVGCLPRPFLEAEGVHRTCARAFGSPCIHEHACVRCSLLRPDPAQRARLAGIRDTLIARSTEAEREGWLGEVEGLRVSLAGAEDTPRSTDAVRRASAWACRAASQLPHASPRLTGRTLDQAEPA